MENWIELQTGLYLEENIKKIGGLDKKIRTLHSAENYCFYDVNDELRQDGSRVYYNEMQLGIQQSQWTYEQLNSVYVSVEIEKIKKCESGAENPHENA